MSLTALLTVIVLGDTAVYLRVSLSEG